MNTGLITVVTLHVISYLPTRKRPALASTHREGPGDTGEEGGLGEAEPTMKQDIIFLVAGKKDIGQKKKKM